VEAALRALPQSNSVITISLLIDCVIQKEGETYSIPYSTEREFNIWRKGKKEGICQFRVDEIDYTRTEQIPFPQNAIRSGNTQQCMTQLKQAHLWPYQQIMYEARH
jgi:hypothetical protein